MEILKLFLILPEEMECRQKPYTVKSNASTPVVLLKITAEVVDQ